MLVPVNIGVHVCMVRTNSPLEGYVRHIAHVNRIVFKEVLKNLNQNNNG